MSSQKFEAQPYYEIADTAVVDTRLSEVEHGCRESLQRFGTAAVNRHTQIEYVGSDGDDYSGFIAMHEIETPEGDRLAIIRSLQFAHDTRIPSGRDSWSAEFDDPEVAKDFWAGWRPQFDGMAFIISAQNYLAHHPDIPRRTVRAQELGMLLPWYDQKGGSTVILDKFSTSGRDLVRILDKYEPSDQLNVGGVYKVSRQRWVNGPPYDAKTCMAAFVVPGNKRTYSVANMTPDTTVVQWSDGMISSHTERELDSNHGPLPLTKADLN